MRITEQTAYDMYDEFLNDFGETRIGNLVYYPADVLKKVDPIAYRCGFNDYCDSLISDGYIIEGINDEEEE